MNPSISILSVAKHCYNCFVPPRLPITAKNSSIFLLNKAFQFFPYTWALVNGLLSITLYMCNNATIAKLFVRSVNHQQNVYPFQK